MTSGRDRIRRRMWRLLDVRTVAAIVLALLTVAGCGTGGAVSAVPPKPISISSQSGPS